MSTKTKIKAVLWDFGGVFTSSPFEAFNRFEAENGLPADFIRRVNAVNPDRNAWARLERNEIGIDVFGDLFRKEAGALGHPVDGRRILPLLAGDVRPQMVAALERCRRELRCVCITNNASFGVGPGMTEDAEKSAEVARIMDMFDSVIESSKVGVRKPDPRIYEIACERAQALPDECVYLDDLGINLKPARALGMTTIKVTDAETAIRELEQAVGFPLS